MPREKCICKTSVLRLSTLALISCFAISRAQAADPRETELKRVVDLAYKGIAANCNGTTYILAHKTITEVKDFRVIVSLDQVSDLDRMNGTQWAGRGCVSFGYHRFWDTATRSWGPWRGGAAQCSSNFQRHYRKINGRILLEPENPWARSTPYYLYPLTCEMVDSALQGYSFGYRPPQARNESTGSVKGQVTSYRILSNTYNERDKSSVVTLEVDYSHEAPGPGLPLLGAWVTKDGKVLSLVSGTGTPPTKRGKTEVSLIFRFDQKPDSYETDSIAFGFYEWEDKDGNGPNELAPAARFQQKFLWRTLGPVEY